jgi:tripeptidyl-peptidase-1
MSMRSACFLATALVAVIADRPPVAHIADELPTSWRKLEQPVATSHPMTIQLSLQQSNLAELQNVASSVSDPKSPSYGKYLSLADLNTLTAPKASHVAAVENWLSASNVPFHRVGELVEVSLTATSAAKMLTTSFHRVANDATGQSVVRADDYMLPAEVDDAVAAVYGMHGLPLPPRKPIGASGGPTPPENPVNVTPAVLQKTYNVAGVTPSGSLKNKQAVAEFQGQTIEPSDLVKFFKDYVPKGIAGDKIHKFVGKGAVGMSGIEAALDVDYIMGNSPGLLTEFWYWGGQDFCADLKNWTNTILSDEAAPLVHSVSYGWQGALSQLGCKAANIKDVDANFAKLAAKGISIIIASGDSGSGYSSFPDDAAHPPHHKKKIELWPSWPASSPWVTSVGSTRFQENKVGQPEMATDQFGSGGGFSSTFPQFKAQASAVAHYLKTATGLPPAKAFNATGRATPDVSALGEGFQVIAGGEVQSVGGTSASTPTFAGLVGLLNEARIKAGKPAMGYLNPFLYQNADAFTDVTVGTNAIGRGGEKLKYGYKCEPGWDPATGLGTPLFGKLLTAAMKAVDSETDLIV